MRTLIISLVLCLAGTAAQAACFVAEKPWKSIETDPVSLMICEMAQDVYNVEHIAVDVVDTVIIAPRDFSEDWLSLASRVCERTRHMWDWDTQPKIGVISLERRIRSTSPDQWLSAYGQNIYCPGLRDRK